MSEANGYATRDDLLGVGPMQRRYVDVVVDGRKFRLRSLNALEATTVQARIIAEDDVEKKVSEIVATNCRLIAACVVNADNQRIFSDLDVVKLLELDSGFIGRLADKCQEHAQLNPNAAEEAEKNSESAPS